MARVQIIGAGLIGLATAYALSERGVTDIRIIEARDGIAEGTSFANAGMVHASLADPWNGPGVGVEIFKSLFAPSPAMALKPSALPHLTGWGLSFLRHSKPAPHWHATTKNYALAAHSLGLINQWRKALSIKDDGDVTGLLKVYRNVKDFDQAVASNQRLATLGLRFESISTDAATAHEPALKPIADNLVGAIYYPDDFKADAYKFCCALADELRRRGVEILTGTPIERLMRTRDHRVGAQSGGEAYQAETTVVTMGARSAGLLKTIGLSLPVRPVKGYSLTFENVSGPNLPVVDDNLHAAITPLGDRIRIAGTAQISGYNSDMKQKNLAPLLGMLQDVYPNVAEGLTLEQATPWCGYRPVSADGMPYIGRTKIPGLAVNTGHGHMGWTFSAGSGDVLADILHDQPSKVDAAAFSPLR